MFYSIFLAKRISLFFLNFFIPCFQFEALPLSRVQSSTKTHIFHDPLSLSVYLSESRYIFRPSSNTPESVQSVSFRRPQQSFVSLLLCACRLSDLSQYNYVHRTTI